MSAQRYEKWVQYNPRTDTYDTPDGTSVPAMMFTGLICLADILAIVRIREDQRAAIKNKEKLSFATHFWK